MDVLYGSLCFSVILRVMLLMISFASMTHTSGCAPMLIFCLKPRATRMLMLCAQWLFDYLNTGEEPPRPADCIFVLAGRHERKVYGIDLLRRDLAPELILSAGRFEWRGFYALDLPGDSGLLKLVEANRRSEGTFWCGSQRMGRRRH